MEINFIKNNTSYCLHKVNNSKNYFIKNSLKKTSLDVFERKNNIAFSGIPINNFQDNKYYSFFESVGRFSQDPKAFIVTSHILPNTIPLLEMLKKHGRIAGVIAKPNSIDTEVLKYLKTQNYNFVDIKKQDFYESNIIIPKIKNLCRNGEKTIVIDVGGYFAPILKELNNSAFVAGIVEDTENGLQKYENIICSLKDNKIPIFSVARSDLKSNYEDFLIGRSIADATLRLLKNNNLNLEDKKIGIIGFGEVGRGAAIYLNKIKEFEVCIHDKNPSVEAFARKNNFAVLSKDELLQKCDILICATGNKSLDETDYNKIKTNCYIASCTSNDDEFDFEIPTLNTANLITHYKGKNILNRGNAINFIDRAMQEKMLKPYIQLTAAGLIKCCMNIDNNFAKSTDKINFLFPEEEKQIISNFKKIVNPQNENAKFIELIEKLNIISSIKNNSTLKNNLKKHFLYLLQKHKPLIQSMNKDLIELIFELINKEKIFIGISGMSGSGKSTFAQIIQNKIAEIQPMYEENILSVINADNYLTDKSEKIKQYGSFDNFINNSNESINTPAAYDIEKQIQDLDLLKNSNEIKIPQYLFDGSGRSIPNSIPVKKARIILSEGIYNLLDKFNRVFDIKVFIDTQEDVIKERWYKRESSRGNSNICTMNIFYKDVMEKAQTHIIPTKKNADIIINGAATQEEINNFINDIINAIILSKNKDR